MKYMGKVFLALLQNGSEEVKLQTIASFKEQRSQAVKVGLTAQQNAFNKKSLAREM
jgi:hypothetical protein